MSSLAMQGLRRAAGAGVMVAVFALAGCNSFKGAIPVSATPPERSYISPGVPDGVQDRLIVGAGVAAAYKDMRIGGYRFTVSGPDGLVVRTIQESVVPPERKVTIMLRPPEGIAVPANLIWEGRNDNGDLVSEGEYTWSIMAWDVKGNVGESPKLVVVVDNTPPSLALSAPFDTFSPNGDGNQDALAIRQADATTEEEWRGELVSAQGLAVRGMVWAGAAQDWSWDGLDDAGEAVPDGVYSYSVSATDLAGNKGSFTLADLRVDTRPGAATLAVSPTAFSPNGDGKLDQTAILPRAENAGEIERWMVAVRDTDGVARRSFQGTGAPPERILFDGKADAGDVLSDGTYRAQIELWYRNGDDPRAISPDFVLDTQKPAATLSASPLLFSPDGDGNADSTSIRQETSDEGSWEGTVRDPTGRGVLSRYWQGKAQGWEWDGRDSSGKIVPDGSYSYVLRSTDAAGNSGSATVAKIEVDARPTPVTLSLDFSAFAPVVGARRPTISLLPSLQLQEGVLRWNLRIQDPAKTTVRTFSGEGAVPASIPFDGKDEEGKVLPDGSGYRGVVQVDYQKGDKAVAASPAFTIKTVPPVGRASADSLVFSPDGDGRSDELTIRQSGSSEELWIGSVMSEAGLPLVSLSWHGRPTLWSWDGKDADGKVVPDGTYTYTLASTDEADNSTVVAVRGIRVDTRGGTVTLAASAPGLSPNGDGIADVVTLRSSVKPQEGVSEWTLALLDSGRNVVKAYSGSGRAGVPAELTWDGRNDSGKVVEGSYQAELTVEYDRGTVSRGTLENPLVVDITGPRVTVAAGPLPFSPDGDGIDDKLTISMAAQTSTSVSSWSVDVVDPEGTLFTRFSGSGAPPKSLGFDGRSQAGELVLSAADYTLVATATDALGNTGRASTALPIDILVVREGDKLRIVISSIYFKEYTADYQDVEPEQARKNLETLDKLAKKLARYPTYAIRIEGNAVRIYWNDPELLEREERETLQPLSKSRADVVKQALVDRGIAAGRMSTVGYGGSQPVVPHSDLENRWKNRRVEFVLVER